MSLTPYAAGQPADQVNRALKQAVRTMDRARHCAVLWFKEVVQRDLYCELGHASVYTYAAKELGFSKTRTGNFLHLARKLDGLPHLKKSMEDGEVGYTKAIEVIKVAGPKNEQEWVEQAKKQSRAKLRETVNRARQQAQGKVPVDESIPKATLTYRVSFELSGEQLARYEALVEAIRKNGGVPKAELLLQAMAALAAGPDDQAVPGTQIHVHQCPDCERATVNTRRGEAVLEKQEIERLECDAQVARPGKPNTATIRPSTRRRVLARDRHRCRAPGCPNTRFLEIHHRIPRSQGGTNTEDNLITLCGTCHRHHHRQARAG